jgi:hypothetical protein
VVGPINSGCIGSAESVSDSAGCLDEWESAAGQLKRPVCEDKPQSQKPTLRYSDNNTSLRGLILTRLDRIKLELQQCMAGGTEKLAA